jgi:hypothetical protein
MTKNKITIKEILEKFPISSNNPVVDIRGIYKTIEPELTSKDSLIQESPQEKTDQELSLDLGQSS